MCISILKGVKGNWPKMKGTSLEGFRETFLNREARLVERAEFWQMNVEKRGYDVLLPSIPWKYSPVKLPWMPKPIVVEWA